MSSVAARKRASHQGAAASRNFNRPASQAALQLQDNRCQAIAQRQTQQQLQQGPAALQRKIVQLKDHYAYGSANTVPHVHCYNGGCHLKIRDRGSIKRYNIVQNNKVHAQADSALNAASGNADLKAIIQRLIDEASGVSSVESQQSESDHDEPDDFPSMSAMWNRIGWDLKGGKGRRR